MRPRKIKIEEWHQGPAINLIAAARPSRSPNARFIGVVGTLLLHLLAYQSVLLGTRAHKVRPPDTQGLGATLMKSEIPPSDTLILLELPNASMSDKPLVEDLASLGPAPKATSIALLSSDPLPHIEIPTENLSDDATSEAAIDSGDPNDRAALFGRYTGQIDARIERAWRRPRSPINLKSVALRESTESSASGASADDTFKCQVRIVQDSGGRVQEVQMLSCNGSVAWQQSLVSAILAVSPLPAPPSPAVFTKAVTMTFRAIPYTHGSAVDDYEIEPSVTSGVADRGQTPTSPIYSRTSSPAGILLSRPTQ